MMFGFGNFFGRGASELAWERESFPTHGILLSHEENIRDSEMLVMSIQYDT